MENGLALIIIIIITIICFLTFTNLLFNNNNVRSLANKIKDMTNADLCCK